MAYFCCNFCGWGEAPELQQFLGSFRAKKKSVHNGGLVPGECWIRPCIQMTQRYSGKLTMMSTGKHYKWIRYMRWKCWRAARWFGNQIQVREQMHDKHRLFLENKAIG